MANLFQSITDICFEEGEVTEPMVRRLESLFKETMLEIIGEDDSEPLEMRREKSRKNAFRDDLRKKVNDL